MFILMLFAFGEYLVNFAIFWKFVAALKPCVESQSPQWWHYKLGPLISTWEHSPHAWGSCLFLSKGAGVSLPPEGCSEKVPSGNGPSLKLSQLISWLGYSILLRQSETTMILIKTNCYLDLASKFHIILFITHWFFILDNFFIQYIVTETLFWEIPISKHPVALDITETYFY